MPPSLAAARTVAPCPSVRQFRASDFLETDKAIELETSNLMET